MGLSYSQLAEGYFGGGLKYRLLDVTFDSSYASGGEPLSGAEFGIDSVLAILLGTVDQDSAGYIVQYDKQVGKLRVFQSAGFTPAGTVSAHSHPLSLKNAAVADGATTRVNAGTNLLGANTGSDVTVAGGGANGGVQNATPTFAGSAVAQAALSEVAGATDLSALTVTALVLGT
jgi:hypothetical protein